MTRHGKIARLPRPLRDQLNRRLDNGECAVRLAEWLNGLPDVRQILQANFRGRPISEQNMSQWKSGGYRDWQARQEILAQAGELQGQSGELSQPAQAQLTDYLVTVFAIRYAKAILAWNGETNEEFNGKIRILRAMCRDIVGLRRSGHSGQRLNMKRQKLEDQCPKSNAVERRNSCQPPRHTSAQQKSK